MKFGVRHRIFAQPLECLLDKVKLECGQARAEKKKRGETYSSGSTFFIGGQEEPSCLLEQLAKEIWAFHAAGSGGGGGVEWWTQVIDTRDDIGYHFDRDYDLEDHAGIHVYPSLASVTYLTTPTAVASSGATLVLNCRGTSSRGEALSPIVDNFIISRPQVGKHFYFDGHLLHAAPSSIEGEDEEVEEGADTEDDDDDESDGEGELRVTFLANVWINHIPKHACRFPASLASKLSPPIAGPLLDLVSPAGTESEVPVQLTMQRPSDVLARSTWHFKDASHTFRVTLPRPLGLDVDASASTIHVLCEGTETSGTVEDLGECSEEEEEEEEKEEEEEEGEEEKEEEEEEGEGGERRAKRCRR